MYAMYSHHSFPYLLTWCFTILEKEVPGIVRTLSTGNSRGLSKRLLGIYSYLLQYDMETKTFPPPTPIELQAMICTGMTKEMLPLPGRIKVHPSYDFLKVYLAEADVVTNEALCTYPVFKVYGKCDECQTLLRQCPTQKDVGLSSTEVMYIMMPEEWT